MEQAERDTPLRQAWKRFAQYDFNAVRQQNNFGKILLWLLALGVLGTALAVARTQLELLACGRQVKLLGLNMPPPQQAELLPVLIRELHIPVLATPIVISVLLAMANRLKPGKKWVLLRGSAEAIKREIYCYRARAGSYSEDELKGETRESLLAKRVEEISRRLMQSEVNMSALRRYGGQLPPKPGGAADGDDGFSDLTPEQYVVHRVKDQLRYFEGKVVRLERQLHLTQLAIYIAGGLGTLLAGLGWDLWVALTVTISGVLASYIGMHNIEASLVVYNQALTDLQNVSDWWSSLSDAGRADKGNIGKLVSYTEKILEGELVGWVQHMQDALAELRNPQQTDAGRKV